MFAEEGSDRTLSSLQNVILYVQRVYCLSYFLVCIILQIDTALSAGRPYRWLCRGSLESKGRRKPGNICWRNILSQCCWQCCMGEQTGRKQKLGCKFCVFKICCLGTQTTKQSGNIRTLFLRGFPNDSSFALTSNICWRHKLKFESWKQKMLSKFSKNIFCVLDPILLLQQCSLVCAGLNELK